MRDWRRRLWQTPTRSPLAARDIGMRLIAITPYGNRAASSRTRVLQWLLHLELDADLHTYIGTGTNQPSVLTRHARAVAAAETGLRRLSRRPLGTVWLHREASPLSRGGLEGKLLSRADLGIFDFDDALQWDRGGGLARQLAPKPRKCRAAAAAADRVIAGNRTLADWASDWCADVRVVPTCVEPAEYGRRRGHELQDPPRLGWIGSPSEESHLRLAAPAVLRLHQTTGARLSVISRGDAPLGALEPLTDRVTWTPEHAAHQLADFDVGIAPLSDTPYARGKCAYKILQYAAAGVPCVGSPIGANAEALDILGFHAADSAEEWAPSISDILSLSASARADVGHRARSAVTRNYSFAAWEPAMRSALGLPARTAESV